MGKKNILKVYRKTRKAFLIEYTCGIFLLAALGVSYFKEIQFNPIFQHFVIGISLFAFASVEFSRIFTRYKITPEKISIIKGIIKQDKKNVYFHPLGFVPDLNVKQSRLQRLFNYGTIYLKSGDIHTFEIKDVSSPHKVLELIENLIEENKSPSTAMKLEKRD
tara:strand:+ start:8 stop:496 length:489 start_codon:yes stop_codon:yes gene_type:complete